MEEKYYQLLEAKNKAEAEYKALQVKPYDVNGQVIIFNYVKAQNEFEKFCGEVLEELMKKNSNVLKNLKENY